MFEQVFKNIDDVLRREAETYVDSPKSRSVNAKDIDGTTRRLP